MLIARLVGRCDSRLKSNTMVDRGHHRGGSITHPLSPFCVLIIPVFIREDQVPTQMSKMTPAFENHPAIKRLSLCGGDDAIVLAICAGVGFAPVKFKRLEFQLV